MGRRIVYHLFNAITPLKTWKCMALLDPRRLMGYLYTATWMDGMGFCVRIQEKTGWLSKDSAISYYIIN